MATPDAYLPDTHGYQSQQGPYTISELKDRKFRIRPPSNDNPSDDDPPSDSIVLDVKACIDDRTNSTTAAGYTARSHLIEVTFSA
jgi:hypothetical protein